MVDVYKITYGITKGGLFAYLFSLFYITTLNLISIYGLALLLEGWMSTAGYVHKLFRFPLILATIAAMLFYNYSKLKKIDLAREKKGENFYAPLVIYTCICILICIYIYSRDKFF